MKTITSLKLTFFCLLLITHHAKAAFYYNQNQSPSYLWQQANPYGKGNTYNIENHNNPYSTFQNPYDESSVWNDAETYSSGVSNYQGDKQGNITKDIYNQNAINNPYTNAGNPYLKNGAKDPYSKNNANNPYSDFQNVYDPNSVRNSPDYSTQITGPNGEYQGGIKNNLYNNSNSNTSPYSTYGNPYNKNNFTNPYLVSPYDNYGNPYEK